jgi:hypothetical protein
VQVRVGDVLIELHVPDSGGGQPAQGVRDHGRDKCDTVRASDR